MDAEVGANSLPLVLVVAETCPGSEYRTLLFPIRSSVNLRVFRIDSKLHGNRNLFVEPTKYNLC